MCRHKRRAYDHIRAASFATLVLGPESQVLSAQLTQNNKILNINMVFMVLEFISCILWERNYFDKHEFYYGALQRPELTVWNAAGLSKAGAAISNTISLTEAYDNRDQPCGKQQTFKKLALHLLTVRLPYGGDHGYSWLPWAFVLKKLKHYLLFDFTILAVLRAVS